LFGAGELQFMEAGVQAALGDQLAVRTLFDDATFAQHQNAVGLLYSAQPVGDDECGATAHQFFERALQAGFSIAVHAGGCFV